MLSEHNRIQRVPNHVRINCPPQMNLPPMLLSKLYFSSSFPLIVYNEGQEEGNVDFVLEHEFGDYKADYDPLSIANTVTKWLNDPSNALLRQMSISAKEAGRPKAAEEIVRNIGTSVHRWKELHSEEDIKIPVLNHSISQVSC